MSFPKYVEYKESGIGWLGDAPKHWLATKLKFLGQAKIGLTYSPSDVVDEEDSNCTLVLRSSNVQDGKIVFQDNVYVQSEIPESLRTKEGDILICSRNGSRTLIGKNAMIDQKSAGLSFGAFMTIYRSDLNHYLFWVFNSQLFKLQSASFLTATINQLTVGNLNSFDVLLPPPEEQTAIANFLDAETGKIDALVAEQRRLIELLKEKRQAVISHAVTKGLNPNAPMKDSSIEWLGEVPEHWKVMKLGFVTNDRCDGPFGSGLKSSHYADEGIRVVRLNNIRHNRFDDSDAAFIDPDHYNGELGGGHDVIAGDLLIAGLGDAKNAVGRSCVAPDGIEPAMVKADCFRYRLDKGQVLTSFMSAQLTIGAPTDAGLMSTGTTRSRMPLSVTSSRKIAFPDLSEQGIIAEFIDERTEQFDSLVSEAERAIELLNERRTALISAAVTGKIDVREYATQETA